MTLFQRLNSAFIYLAEAAYRIFSPHKDAYPATGLQPYSGEVYAKESEW
ncbi:nicotinate phosphoribosyltransferase [Leptolyngbya sp. BC1307]|nr:nicotinate phosphoribosyltransferase [Leptolyngbya sp. BC1307]